MPGRIFLQNAWRELSGLPEVKIDKSRTPSLDKLKETEWSPLFEKLMRNRLIIGAMRYGCLHEKGKAVYDRIDSMEKRLRKYKETGNLEFLVDIANLALCEFEEGKHPNKHFHSIDDGEHVNTKGNL